MFNSTHIRQAPAYPQHVTVKHQGVDDAARIYGEVSDKVLNNILNRGTIGVFGVESNWLAFTDIETGVSKFTCKFKINGDELVFVHEINLRDVKFEGAEIRKKVINKLMDALTTHIVDHLTRTLTKPFMRELEYTG